MDYILICIDETKFTVKCGNKVIHVRIYKVNSSALQDYFLIVKINEITKRNIARSKSMFL